MIAKHQLILSLMNMLADGVGSCSRAKGIPTAFSARGEDEDYDKDQESSVMSKSFSMISSAKKKNDQGDILSRSIHEHASQLHDFVMAKRESSCLQIEHATNNKKCKHAIQLKLGWL